MRRKAPANVKLEGGQAQSRRQDAAHPCHRQGRTARKVVVTVLKGGKRVGSTRLAKLKGRKTVKVRLKARLPKGRYKVRVSARGKKAV